MTKEHEMGTGNKLVKSVSRVGEHHKLIYFCGVATTNLLKAMRDIITSRLQQKNVRWVLATS